MDVKGLAGALVDALWKSGDRTELKEALKVYGNTNVPLDFGLFDDLVVQPIVKLRERCAALEAQVAELRDGAVKDFGVFQEGHHYPKGAGVTVKGAFWIAQEATWARPGTNDAESRAWRLAAKGDRVKLTETP